MSQALGSRGELLVDLFNTMEWLEEREKFAHLVMQCVTIISYVTDYPAQVEMCFKESPL